MKRVEMKGEPTIRHGVYVVYSTKDLTEGRSSQYPMWVCETLATARRLAKGNYVQGTDCPIEEVELVKFPGHTHWYGPVNLIPPNNSDLERQKMIDARDEVINRVKAAGFTTDEIALLVLGK